MTQRAMDLFERTRLLSYSIHLKYMNLDLPGPILTQNGSGCIPNPSDFFKSTGLWNRLLKHLASSFWSTAIQSLNRSKKQERTITLRGASFFLKKPPSPTKTKSLALILNNLPIDPEDLQPPSDLPGPIFGLSAPALTVQTNFTEEKTQSLVRCQFFGVRRIFVDIWRVSVFFFFLRGRRG